MKSCVNIDTGFSVKIQLIKHTKTPNFNKDNYIKWLENEYAKVFYKKEK